MWELHNFVLISLTTPGIISLRGMAGLVDWLSASSLAS